MDTPRTISGAAGLAGVIGWPVEHSRSPRLHGFWLATHGVDGAYVPLAVAPARFEAAVLGLVACGFRGANVTIPHKEAALALCDEVAGSARRAGAVNTLVFEGGRILGSNTDGYGFLEALREQAPGFDPRSGPAVLLGAGGAARAIGAALLDAGCPRLVLVNRTRGRAEALAAALADGAGVAAAEPRGVILARQPRGAILARQPRGAILARQPRGAILVAEAPPLTDAALLVNTTSLGMSGQPPLAVDLSPLPPAAVVADIVYVPLETPLLAAARARGLVAVDGLGMLLHQARPGFEAWFGVAPTVDAALRAFVAAGIPPR